MYLHFLLFIFQRSSEWFDEDTLFTSGLSVCPLNAKVNKKHVTGGELSEATAVGCYKMATQLNEFLVCKEWAHVNVYYSHKTK